MLKITTLKIIIGFSLIIATSCKVSEPEKFFAEAEKEITPYDAIIVPGYPFNDEIGSWDIAMKERMHWAKFLYDKGMTKNIICSGGAVYTKYAECKIMRLYALEMGIPDEHIFMDSTAEHSTENVYYSYYVAKAHGFKKIAVATDVYQTKGIEHFVRKMKKKLDVEIDLIPIVMDSIKNNSFVDYKIDYSKAVGSQFVNITETQNMYYRIKGTLGWNVDWKNPPLDSAKFVEENSTNLQKTAINDI